MKEIQVLNKINKIKYAFYMTVNNFCLIKTLLY